MSRLIDVDKLNRKDVNCANVPMNFIDTAPTVEAIPKADYENRLKADLKAILVELQLEIKELWDSRYDVWLDNQYYIGKSDTLGEVDELIQEHVNALKENEDGNHNQHN